MNATKIYQALVGLDAESHKRFRSFLLSPYFCRSKTALKAYLAIYKHISKPNQTKLSKQTVWKAVYGAKTYNDTNMRKLNSDLMRFFKEFLIQEQFKTDKGQKNNYFMQAVHQRGMDSLKSVSIRQSDRYFDKIPYRNADYFLQKYIKEKEYYQLIDFDKDREGKSNVEDLLKNLDLFYLTEKVYFYLSSLVRMGFLNSEFDFLLIKEILSYIETNELEMPKILSILYKLVLAYSILDKGDEHILFSQILNDMHSFASDEEANEIYTGALNYSIAMLNRGVKVFHEEYISLIDQMIEKGCIFESDGYFSISKFRNACSIALRLEKFEWTEKLIDEYGHHLDPKDRDNAISYSQALLHFRKKEFKKVPPLLSIIQYDDTAFGLAAKLLLAHAYYELDEFDALESLIDAFKVFLSRRKDIPVARRKNYSVHLRYLFRLIRIIPGDARAIEIFKEDLIEQGKVINSELLIEKAEKLL